MIFLMTSIILILAGLLIIVKALSKPSIENDLQENILPRTDKLIEENFTKLLDTLYAKSASYHDFKEKMAHAGIAVQLAITSALISKKISDPIWTNIFDNTQLITSTYIIIWILLHIFVRWQLRKKRAAAIELATYQKALLRWAYSSPTKDDLKLYPKKTNNISFTKMLYDCIDYISPIPFALVSIDITKEGYPIGIVKIWEEQEKKGTGAYISEVIICIFSYLMLLIGLYCVN